MSREIRLAFISAGGVVTVIEAVPGRSVRDVALDHAVPGIVGECGGYAACGTCHLYIGAAGLAILEPPAAEEAMMLEAVLDRREDSRLGCQIPLTAALDGLSFRVPARQF